MERTAVIHRARMPEHEFSQEERERIRKRKLQKQKQRQQNRHILTKEPPTPQTKEENRKAREAAIAAQKRHRRLQQRIKTEAEICVPVPKDYEGKTAVCFASGPSLTKEVVEFIRPYHDAGKVVCFGLNDTYRIVPFLDEFYACDEHWWQFHLENPQEGRHVLESQPETRIWGNNTAIRTLQNHKQIHVVRGNGTRGFSEDPKLIHWGSNSGSQLLNLAYLLGVSKMLLVGYNMCVPHKMGPKGHHFFGPHPKPMSQSAAYKGFVKQYHTIQGHIKKLIVNCTPDSALDCFQKGDLETEILASMTQTERLDVKTIRAKEILSSD